MELDEIFAALAAHATDPTKTQDIATKLRADSRTAAIGTALFNKGVARGKKELEPEVTRLTGELAQRDEAITEKDTEIEAIKVKVPDAARIEADLKVKYDKKLKEADDKVAAKDQTLRQALKRVAREKLVTALVKKNVDPDYAREVVAAKYDDRLHAKDDGSLSVLEIGGTTAYDGDTEDAQIEALAVAATGKVDPKWIASGADIGGGASNGHGSTALTHDQITERKRENSMYRGML